MIKPLYDNVLLQKAKPEIKTKSGIILTTNNDDDKSIAKVIAIGKGSLVDGVLQPVEVKPGQLVLYKKYSATEVKYQDEDYLIIASKELLAVVEE
ncbi:MAG: co-chaperone GroES [Erysipelotrichales bacterium]|nr:co-chaperone GroES [Erysipelotrichales bacterium]